MFANARLHNNRIAAFYRKLDQSLIAIFQFKSRKN